MKELVINKLLEQKFLEITPTRNDNFNLMKIILVKNFVFYDKQGTNVVNSANND
jgi:hypothetical protein